MTPRSREDPTAVASFTIAGSSFALLGAWCLANMAMIYVAVNRRGLRRAG
jgi:hypothetical protein